MSAEKARQEDVNVDAGEILTRYYLKVNVWATRFEV
jgi:hypothetical protein